MTIASTQTISEFLGNGATVNFPIEFEFTDVNTIQVSVDTNLVLFNFNDALNPTAVIFDQPPAVGAKVVIQRVTPRVQETQLDESQSFGDQAEVIEDALDRVVQMIQEIVVGVTTVNPQQVQVPSVFQEWQISTDYLRNQLVRDGIDGRFYTVVADYTSNANLIEADISNGDLELFNRGEEGARGSRGEIGAAGIDGAQGPQGIAGNDGADGFFSEVASQAEAEVGTDNTKGMTALRVRQAIEAQVSSIIDATGFATGLAALSQLVTQINSEVQLLKGAITTTLGRYTGRQRINQNQILPLDIDVSQDQDGVGSPLKFNSVGTEFVSLTFYIVRGDVSATSFEAVAQYIRGRWWLCRKDSLLLDETLEFDGVTLSIETTGTEGQIQYISEPVAGPFVNEEHYISWIGQEIRQGVLI